MGTRTIDPPRPPDTEGPTPGKVTLRDFMTQLFTDTALTYEAEVSVRYYRDRQPAETRMLYIHPKNGDQRQRSPVAELNTVTHAGPDVAFAHVLTSVFIVEKAEWKVVAPVVALCQSWGVECH